MNKPRFPALFLVLASFFSTPAHADSVDDFIRRDPNRVVLSAGMYNVTADESEHRYPTYTAELRLSQIPVWKLHPWLGFEYEHNNIRGIDLDSYWAGGGLETDIDLYSDWLVLTLQTGAGYYNAGNDVPTGWRYLPGDGLEFRHQIELGARFGDGYRAGIGMTHMSNAGIRDNNNSINSLVLNFHVPLNWTDSSQ